MRTEPKSAMRIICGTDFSKPAEQAANAAAALAARLKETLVLAHSVEGAGLGASSPKIFDAVFAHVGEQLQAEAVRLRALIPAQAEGLGIGTEVEVVPGPDPAKAICQAAARFGADVICMGTHGRTGLKRGLFGSVAEQVTRHAACPVLAVR